MKLISEIIQVYTMSENRAKEQQIKQLEMAKADDHYKIYTETIPKCERNSKDPKTPTKKDIEKKSYRQFAGLVRAWKLTKRDLSLRTDGTLRLFAVRRGVLASRSEPTTLVGSPTKHQFFLGSPFVNYIEIFLF